ncbi:MAG: ATP-binding protein [Flavobacteriales bacterium]|nr:ATP-binding protein [Flavobacteriales bacterium]
MTSRCQRWLLLLVVYSVIGTTHSQESPERLDSILPLLDPAIEDTIQMDMLISVAESWTTSDNAFPYLHRLDSLTRHLLESDNADVRRRGRHGRGAYNFFVGYHAKFARNIPLALHSFQSALADFKVHNERHATAETNDALGVLFNTVGRPDRAASFFQEELRIGRDIKHQHVTTQALIHLAGTHSDRGQPRIAEAYLDSCRPGSAADSSALFIERGRMRTLKGQHAQAILLLRQAVQAAEHSSNAWDLLPALTPLARSYYAVNDHAQGLAAAERCTRIAAEMGDRTAQCGCTVLMGIGRMAIGDLVGAERELLEGARLARLNNNVGVARELGDEGSMLRTAELLKDLYRRQGRTQEALDMTEQWVLLKDSVARMSGQDDIMLFEFEREQFADSLAHMNAVAAQQAEHDRTIAIETSRRKVFVLAIALLVAIVIAIWSRVRLLRRSNAAILAAQEQVLASERALATEAVRTRIARDVHDQLGSDLTKLVMLSSEVKDVAKSDPSDLSVIASDIERIAGEANRSLGDIVWAIDPHNDSLAGLTERMRLHCERMLKGCGVEHTIDCVHEGPDRPLDPATRRDIHLILREALNNAIKYARARHIRVALHTSTQRVDLVIEDDGVGFTSADHAGHGTANMRQRAQRCGGRLILENAGERGTRITFTANLPEPAHA